MFKEEETAASLPQESVVPTEQEVTDETPKAEVEGATETTKLEEAGDLPETVYEKRLPPPDHSKDFALTEPTHSFAETIEKVTGEEYQEDAHLPAVLGLEALVTRSWSKFIPNTDPNRKVLALVTDPAQCVLELRRKNDKPGEGVTIDNHFFYKAFGKNLESLPEGKQLTFLLNDNRTKLVGYVKAPKRGDHKVYLPIAHWPESVPPPRKGFVQKVRVKTIIIG